MSCGMSSSVLISSWNDRKAILIYQHISRRPISSYQVGGKTVSLDIGSPGDPSHMHQDASEYGSKWLGAGMYGSLDKTLSSLQGDIGQQVYYMDYWISYLEGERSKLTVFLNEIKEALKKQELTK